MPTNSKRMKIQSKNTRNMVDASAHKIHFICLSVCHRARTLKLKSFLWLIQNKGENQIWDELVKPMYDAKFQGKWKRFCQPFLLTLNIKRKQRKKKNEETEREKAKKKNDKVESTQKGRRKTFPLCVANEERFIWCGDYTNALMLEFIVHLLLRLIHFQYMPFVEIFWPTKKKEEMSKRENHSLEMVT